MATAAERLALGYTPKQPGSAVATRPYVPNFTIPDPRVEAQYQRAAAEAAHGERVNPTTQKPAFAANDPRAYGDGRFGATPNPGPNVTRPAPMPAAAAAPKAPLYSRPLGEMARGGASAAGGVAKKAAGMLSAPLAVGAAGIAGAAQGMGTDTEEYARRFGLENTEPGLLRDLGIRSLGVASDVGNSLTLGLAGNFYRDKQNPMPTVTPDPSASPLAQMDPTSPARQDPANPMKPEQGASAALASPVTAAKEVRPGIYRQGNSFSDSAEGAAAGARPAPISAQNMAAADALAARSSTQNPLVQAAGGGSQNWTARDNAIMAANIRDGVDPYRGTSVSPNPIVSVINDTSGGNGMSWEEAGRERSLRMAAERLVPGAKTALKAFYESMGMRQEGKSREREANADRAFRAGESARDRLMRGQELSARLGESAADRALKSQELADNMKTNDVKRQAAGVELTAAQRMAALQGEYLNAETDAARDAAAKKLQGLSGKAPAADWGVQVTPGVKNIDGSTTEGSVYKFNKATGEVQRVDGQQKPAVTAMPPPNQRPVGATSTVNGKTAVWNGTKWVPQ